MFPSSSSSNAVMPNLTSFAAAGTHSNQLLVSLAFRRPDTAAGRAAVGDADVSFGVERTLMGLQECFGPAQR
jgi:hypothetical protein